VLAVPQAAREGGALVNRCERCGRRYDRTGAPNCVCEESALEARAEAVRTRRCLVCAGFAPAAGTGLCARHEDERRARRYGVARALRVYRAEGNAEAVRALRDEARTLDRRAS
jgi:hypothetical protein